MRSSIVKYAFALALTLGSFTGCGGSTPQPSPEEVQQLKLERQAKWENSQAAREEMREAQRQAQIDYANSAVYLLRHGDGHAWNRSEESKKWEIAQLIANNIQSQSPAFYYSALNKAYEEPLALDRPISEVAAVVTVLAE